MHCLYYLMGFYKANNFFKILTKGVRDFGAMLHYIGQY